MFTGNDEHPTPFLACSILEEIFLSKTVWDWRKHVLTPFLLPWPWHVPGKFHIVDHLKSFVSRMTHGTHGDVWDLEIAIKLYWSILFVHVCTCLYTEISFFLKNKPDTWLLWSGQQQEKTTWNCGINIEISGRTHGIQTPVGVISSVQYWLDTELRTPKLGILIQLVFLGIEQKKQRISPIFDQNLEW